MRTGDIRIDYDKLPEGTTEEDVLHELNHAIHCALGQRVQEEPLLKALLLQIPTPYAEETDNDKVRQTIRLMNAKHVAYLRTVGGAHNGSINDWQTEHKWGENAPVRSHLQWLGLVAVRNDHGINDPGITMQICTITPFGKTVLKDLP